MVKANRASALEPYGASMGSPSLVGLLPDVEVDIDLGLVPLGLGELERVLFAMAPDENRPLSPTGVTGDVGDVAGVVTEIEAAFPVEMMEGCPVYVVEPAVEGRRMEPAVEGLRCGP